jgi:hypothetical protein
MNLRVVNAALQGKCVVGEINQPSEKDESFRQE